MKPLTPEIHFLPQLKDFVELAAKKLNCYLDICLVELEQFEKLHNEYDKNIDLGQLTKKEIRTLQDFRLLKRKIEFWGEKN